MTVLWILLGVLAAIILLLCLPLTLRLSWLPKPEQPAPCLLTDEVNKEIEALDLPQTDRQLLRQMVEQTKAPPVLRVFFKQSYKKMYSSSFQSSMKAMSRSTQLPFPFLQQRVTFCQRSNPENSSGPICCWVRC